MLNLSQIAKSVWKLQFDCWSNEPERNITQVTLKVLSKTVVKLTL